MTTERVGDISLVLEVAGIASARDEQARALAAGALAPVLGPPTQLVPVGRAPGALLGAVLTHFKIACGIQHAPRLVLACDVDGSGDIVDTAVDLKALARGLALADAACRLLVTRTQASEIRPALTLFPHVEVWAVFELGDALEALGVLARLDERPLWVGREREVAEVLFRFVCSNVRPLMGWRLFAAMTRGVLRGVERTSTAAWQLGFARDVARRHQGETALLEWDAEQLSQLDSSLRFEAIAHLVQSASDGDLLDVDDYVKLATEALGDAPVTAGTTKVRGAIGRALAAVGDWPAARDSLEQAVSAWSRLDRPGDASYALCELLRVLGLDGAAPRIAELEGVEVQSVLDVASAVSRGFVRLALGRAWVQVGDAEKGLVQLEHADAVACVPCHDGCHRWRAMALDALGRHGDADQVRAAGGGYLARLDAALRDGRGVDEAFEELLADPNDGEELRRLLGRLAPGVAWRDRRSPELVRRAMREWRY